MAETLRELVVRLSLESGNFSRNMRTINQQIKEAESTFRLAGAGIDNFGSTVKGAEAKLQMLKSKLDLQKTSVDQHSKALQEANKKLVEIKGNYDTYSQRLDAAKAAHERNGQAVEAARAKYERLAATIGTTNATTRTAADELTHAQEAYAQSGAAVQQLEGQVAALTKQMQTHGDRVSDLQTKYNNAKAAMLETEREVRRLSSSWTQAGAALSNFSQKASKVASGLTSVGRSLSTHVTAPLAALGAAATKASIDFESAMAGVRKTLPRDSGDEATAMKILSQRVQELSLETASTAEEIAGVVETAGQLGIQYGKNGDTIMEFAKTMVMLGDSTDMVAADAAKSAARFFNIMGTAPEMYNNYGSAVTELGNRFATTESEIVEMSMRLAGAGRQVGLSEAEILGFATALSSVGIKAQMGGSAFSKALINMELAVQTGNKQLKSFADLAGMTSEQFVEAWKEKPAVAFQAFINGLAKIEDDGDSAIAFLQDMGFKEIRLRDTTLRLAGSTNLLADAQRSANMAWEGGDLPGQNALVNEATKRYQTMASKLIQLKNRALMFARTIGNDLIPMVTNGINVVQGLMEKFAGLDEGTRLVIEKFAIFAATLGPAILVVGKLVGAIGKIAGVAGTFATWMGRITTAASGTLHGLSALVAGINPVALGIAAITAAVVVGVAALYDYASGARAAREAVKGLNEQAKNWKENAAETFFSGAGVSSFGMSKSDFEKSTTETQRWMDSVTRIWSDGEKKTTETVEQWSNSYKKLNDNTRRELSDLKKNVLEGSTADKQITKDIAKLDSIDKQVERLLQKNKKGKLSEKEKLKLEDLIQQGEAIRLKYQLEPQGSKNAGYEKLKQNLQAEVDRLQAAGASDKQISDTYGKAAAAAAEGYKQVRDQIDDNYRTRHQEIQQIEDEKKRQIELNKLNADYQKQRQDAAKEYAGVLRDTYGPVLKEQTENGAGEKVQKIVELLNEYERIKGQGGDTSGVLAELNNLNLDESELTEYYSTLSQIQSLMDEGLVSEDQVKEMFPEANIESAMNNLAAIQTYLNEIGSDTSLEGLKTMIGEALPEEVQKILIGLDMTQAAEDWSNFAKEPRAITTAAKVSRLEPPTPEELAAMKLNGLTGIITEMAETPGGATGKQIKGVLGYLGELAEPEAGLADKTVSGLLGYLGKIDKSKLNPAELVAIDGLIGYLQTVMEEEGGASLPAVTGLKGYLKEVLDGGGDFEKAALPTIRGLIGWLSGYSENPSGVSKNLPGLDTLSGLINAYTEKPGATKPEPQVYATIGMRPIDATTLAAWQRANPITQSATIKVGNIDGVNSVEDLFNKENVKFYEGGVEVKLTPEVASKVTMNSLVAVEPDATGENGEPIYHVIITPIIGTPEGDAATLELLNKDKGLLGGFSAQNKVSRVTEEWDKYTKAIERLNQAEREGNTSGAQQASEDRFSALMTLQDILNGLDDEDIGAIAARITQLMAALNGGEGTEEENAKWAEELNGLMEFISAVADSEVTEGVGDDVAAGIAQGMEGYDFSGSAADVCNGILSAMANALMSHSPAQALVPTGQNVTAGIGQGMVNYDLSADAALVAENIQAAFAEAMTGELFTGAATPIMNALSVSFLGYSWETTMNGVANKAANAAKSKFSASRFKPAGVNAMKGLAQGIKDGTSFVLDAIGDVADQALQEFKDKWNIKSPSRVFRDEIGVMAMRGFGLGIEKEMKNQVQVIAKASRYLTESARAGVYQAGVTNTDNSRTYNNTSSFNVYQTIEGSTDSYTAQQREAARMFANAARRLA